eukprot:7862803-Prorocentrum_lima.AAC.1
MRAENRLIKAQQAKAEAKAHWELRHQAIAERQRWRSPDAGTYLPIGGRGGGADGTPPTIPTRQ